MGHYRYMHVLLALALLTPLAQANVITVRTGQVGGSPGSCSGLDDTFRTYTPQPQCGQPILTAPFQSADFDHACAGPAAVVNDGLPGLWLASLACDPDARWISNDLLAPCMGNPLSVLYCAAFYNDSECTMADSIRVCWAVDDYLGDPAGGGANPDGAYLNGVSLGTGFSGGAYAFETTAVAYNVPLALGPNRLEFYQRDAGCAVAGLLLSATIYTNCSPVPARESSWGSIKALYR